MRNYILHFCCIHSIPCARDVRRALLVDRHVVISCRIRLSIYASCAIVRLSFYVVFGFVVQGYAPQGCGERMLSVRNSLLYRWVAVFML